MRNSKGQFVKGHKVPKKWRENAIKANLGNSRHVIPHTAESKNKISMKRKGQLLNEKNHMWKGEQVSYRNLHRWVERHLGKPKRCEYCGKTGSAKQIHWANKSHLYLRDLSDWLRLCVSCHKKYDKVTTISNVKSLVNV